MSSSDSTNATALAIFGVFWLVWLLVICAVVVVTIVAYWRIATKAGYSGVFSLLMLVPLANIVLLIYFAFTDWPIELELRHLRGGGAPRPGTSVMPT